MCLDCMCIWVFVTRSNSESSSFFKFVVCQKIFNGDSSDVFQCSLVVSETHVSDAVTRCLMSLNYVHLVHRHYF